VARTVFYPANDGFLPAALSEAGAPLDVPVTSPYPVMPGSVIRSRPVGILNMTDESGKDHKLIAVPHSKLSKQYEHIKDIDDVPELLLKQIAHYFENYKDLEEGKWVKVESWSHAEDARKEIIASRERYLKEQA